MDARSTSRFAGARFFACARLIRPRRQRPLARQSKTWLQENWQAQAGQLRSGHCPVPYIRRAAPPREVDFGSALFPLLLFTSPQARPSPHASLWSRLARPY